MRHLKISLVCSAILNLLFPERRSEKRRTFDFSTVSPRELARTLPMARQPPKLGPENIKIAVCLSYKNPAVRALVWYIKTKRDRHAFVCAGYILAEKMAGTSLASHAPVIIPMPIHQKRRRERGYNQCELLAREMKKHCDSKNCCIEIRTDILFRNYRKENAKKQAFKKRAERIAGMKGVFSAHQSVLGKIENFSGRQFIIIDDVLTTGSTMNEAILTLQKAGCKNVSGLALAH